MFIIMFTKTHIVPVEVQELISNRCLYRALTCYKNVEQCYPERTCTKINMPVCMHVQVQMGVCMCLYVCVIWESVYILVVGSG